MAPLVLAGFVLGCGGSDGFFLNPTIADLGVRAAALGPNEVLVEWDASPATVTAYDVYRDGALLVSVAANARRYNDVTVRAGVLYRYTVAGVRFPTGPVALGNAGDTLTPATAGWGRSDVADGEASSLVLDETGAAYVVFYDFPARRLKAATDALGVWVVEIVDDVTDAGLATALARDGGGALHVAYAGGGTGLRYATNASGGWVVTIVDPAETDSVAIALDASGAVHIAASGARYATNAGGSWTVETVGVFAPAARNVAIGVDGAGAVHLAYLAGLTGALTLYHATNETGAWEEAAAATDVGGPVALVVDAADRVHFVTFRGVALVHLVDGGEETIDSPGPLHGDLSVAIGPAETLHVAYYAAQRDLKVATDASGAWTSVFVDADGDVGAGNAIAVDAAGRARVTYRDATRRQLVYAVE